MHRSRVVVAFGLALVLAGATAPAQAPAGAKPADQPAPAAAEKLKNTLRWKTNDVDSRGFDVYRAEKEEGPFVRLTARPIDGRVRGPKGEFAFVDDTIEAGKAYWYYVEVVSVVGERSRFTPVMKAAAKGGPAAAKP